MRNIFLIARREYLEQIRSRAFRLSTVGLPLVFALLLYFGFSSGKHVDMSKHLAIASNDPVLASAVRSGIVGRSGQARIDVISPQTQTTQAELREALRSGRMDGVLTVDRVNGQIEASYTSKSSGDFVTVARLGSAVSDGLVSEKLQGAGLTTDEIASLLKHVKVTGYQMRKDGSVVKGNADFSFWKGYVMALLLCMTTMLYGMNVARSILQEKTSRIFEVMLSITRPDELLAGKLMGVGAVGLTQILIWAAAVAFLVASPLAAALMTDQIQLQFTVQEAILFPLYFLLGYLLFSALFAGLAAICETEQELQMFMPLAAAPVWLGFLMINLIMNDANSIWAVAGSLFPPTAPIVMFLRMASEQPPLWQIGLSVALMAVSIWATLKISARLYRVGILMYGKRATLPEILRWIRCN